MRRALIVGLKGLTLSSDEAQFLAKERPLGLIVFARNIADPDQLRRLIDDARSAISSPDVLTLVDQEGGRVRRLRPPHWRDLPAARKYADLYQSDRAGGCDAARAAARLTAQDLLAVGLNTNCAPCADVPVAGANAVIGDRAYGETWEQVAALASDVAEGYLAGSVLPVVKHIPGHGRADADSHLALPVVRTELARLEKTDFAAFRALAHLPAAMTAHVVYTAIDDAQPATTSRRVIDDVIRGSIGFDGLLMSDDLSMKALAGTIAERAAAAITAGCDCVLHCNGDLDEMKMAAASAPALDGRALERFEACLRVIRKAPEIFSDAHHAAATGWLMQLGADPFPIESV